MNIIPFLSIALILLPHSNAEAVNKGRKAMKEYGFTYEAIQLTDEEPAATVHMVYKTHTVTQHPVILMPGSLDKQDVPFWSKDLVNEGYMLAAFSVAYAPDPDRSRRPQWLYFDQRFAHGYVLMGQRAITDTTRIVKYLVSRGDVHPDKIGWMGSSSTGIPALSVATQGPKLAAICVFVSTGAYKEWLESWHTNQLWQGKTKEFWPETLEMLTKYDPILHVDTMYPTPVLMVSGSEDNIVDPKTARSFFQAAQLYYQDDESRLRLVIYEGFGHNLPLDVVTMYTEHWFHLYMHPHKDPPAPVRRNKELKDKVKQTQINAAEHTDIIGAETKEK